MTQRNVHGFWAFSEEGAAHTLAQQYAWDTDSLSWIPVTSGSGGAVTVTPDTYSAKSVTLNTSGDQVGHDPAAGKAVRLHYLSLSAGGGNSADVTVDVKFGSSSRYKVSLKPGAIFARNIGAGRRYLQGAVDENLVVNLSANQTVHCSFEYDEI